MAQEGPVGAFPPPPGHQPDFDNPEDLGRTTLILGLAIIAGITSVMFGFRIYAKKVIAPGFLLEDWTCIAGYALLMTYISAGLVMANFGEGYHEWEVTKEAYKEVMRWLYISSILYCPAAYFTKITLLLLEARVFAVYETVAKTVHIFIVILLICYIPIMMLKTVVCVPIRAAWDSDVKPANCLNQRAVFISDMCLGVITDFVILILPIPVTCSLRMPVWTKIKVIALLSAGGIATGVSIFRLYKSIEFPKPADSTEGFVLLDLTTALELAIGVVCASLPAINLLVHSWMNIEEGDQPHNVPRTGMSDGRRKGNSFSSWTFQTRTSTTRNPFSRVRTTSTRHGTSRGSIVIVGSRSEDEWSYNPRATSLDGRRQGWLRNSNDEAMMSDPESDPMHTNAGREAQKSWEAAWNEILPSDPHRPPG